MMISMLLKSLHLICRGSTQRRAAAVAVTANRRAVTKLLLISACVLAPITISVGYAHAASTDQTGAPIKILALGDSLTAGYGLADVKDAFPAQLERALIAKGHTVTIVPGGISGDTTAGGVSRLEWSLAAKPDAVIVELGANDGLRAIDPKVTLDNMRAIVRRIQKDGIPILIAGMLAPPNLGRDYGDRFNAVFPTVAQESGALLYPFFLDGVVANPALNQEDRMHPTPKGVAVIVERILPAVEKLLVQARKFKESGKPAP